MIFKQKAGVKVDVERGDVESSQASVNEFAWLYTAPALMMGVVDDYKISINNVQRYKT